MSLGPWVFLGPLAVCAAVAAAIGNVGQPNPSRNLLPLRFSKAAAVVCSGAVFLSIAIRSANGHGVGMVHEGNADILWGLAIAACAGNVLGGFVADRFGWVATCVLALVVSAPLLSFFVDRGAAVILGMAIFQMTMPVTLTAVGRVFPGEAGLAFGLAAFAVLAGTVPAYLCPAEWITPRPLLFSLPLISAAAILVGLPPIVRQDKMADR
jgi:FSR family fosmidomycin resistance protein-like MFS transporter